MPNGTPRQTRTGGGWGIGILVVIIALIIIGWGWGGGDWWRGSTMIHSASNNPTNNGTPDKTLDKTGTTGNAGTANGPVDHRTPANNGAPAH
jgi:hypothetical protein